MSCLRLWIARGIALSLLILAPAIGQAQPLSGTLGDSLDLPDQFSLEIETRLRYERLSDQFRAGLPGSDDLLVLRTLLRGTWQVSDWLTLGAEIEDSRALSGENQGFISTTVVNSFEFLQSYAQLTFPDLAGGQLDVKAGRLTADFGSRRFLARNRYRNTINGFTGIAAEWTKDDSTFGAFWTMPVQRLPFGREELRDNEYEFDRESFDFQFWGANVSTPLPWGDRGELFLYGLHSDGSMDPPRRVRRLYTPGFRLFRKPAAGRIDYQLETAIQFGRSRQSTSGSGTLHHFAYFQHAEIGYTFPNDWKPRVAFRFDYASGDHGNADSENGRFDTLFGARRFDFGPTGIYGPFARSNLSSPGIRLAAKPSRALSGFVDLRAFWLASDTDRWAGGGLVDPSGDSGNYLGTQIEFRIRWQIIPKNVLLELGYAHLFVGEFIEDAPASPDRGDADYLYTQLVFKY